MRRSSRPGIGLMGAVAVLGAAWPAFVLGHGVLGAGGAAACVAVSLLALTLLSHPLVRSRPALLGIAGLMAMTPFAAFLIGCVIVPRVPDGLEPLLPRAMVSLIAFLASLAALFGFLLSLVRVLQIRSGAVRAPAE